MTVTTKRTGANTMTRARGYSSMLIRDVPAGIRQAARRQAIAEGLSFSDVLAGILGDSFGVEFTSSERNIGKDAVGGKDPNITVRVPPELHRRIRMAAAEDPNGTMRGIVISKLAEHYGKKAPDAGRRPRLAKNRLTV